jgi:DNA segregation ATPase FtsK/SpoIIIE, S-DNA-T family
MNNEILVMLEEQFELTPEDSRKLTSGTHTWIGPKESADRLRGLLEPLAAKLVVGRSHESRVEGESIVPVSRLGEFILDGQWAFHAAQVESAADAAVHRFCDWTLSKWRSPESVLRRVQNDYEADLASIEDAKINLFDALARHGASVSDFERFDSADALPIGLWTREADVIAATADSTRVPFLQRGQLEARAGLLKLARPLMAAYELTVNSVAQRRDASIAEIYKRFFDEWIKSTRTAVDQGQVSLDTSAMASLPSPRSFVPRWMNGDGNPADTNLPLVYLGSHYLAGHKMDAELVRVSPDKKTSNTGSVEVVHKVGSFGYPIVLDLDAAGGFVTDQRSIVESSVLQLLESIEPGMLKVEGVDPVGLGKSLDFLYGLNDAGDKVLGDAIWTTSEQVSRLLVEVEKHVTFVTQKYLQGQHSTLTEYNVAAGEVAEPYRVILFYDFPRMFTRDGKNHDQEALTRFHRLASVGRRAGVFFFVVAHPDHKSNQAVDSLPKIYDNSSFGAPTSSSPRGMIQKVSLTWRLEPVSAPSAEVRDGIYGAVLRGLASHSEKRVLPATVAELARTQDLQSKHRGLTVSSGIARSEDPSSWWARSSSVSLESRFGRMGSSGLAAINFNSKMESSALIGGQTGSGKSSLFHALILDLVLNYSPQELELYLVDLKEGVEFKQYAESRLPHARAVAIESSREFAVSVLSELELQINRRGALFKSLGGTVVDLPGYRAATGKTMPRIVLMIDEFHKLFTTEDSLKREGERLLERVIKEGRAFGIHVVLGSQTIALVGSAFRSLADQIFYRLVLSSSESDSRLLLGENNPDAQLLTRPGEGIMNTKSGLREGNNRFQAAYWDAAERHAILDKLRHHADSEGWSDRAPVVFEGSEPQMVESLPLDEFGRSLSNKELSILVGSPMSLDGPYRITLDRSPGRNVLLVDDEGRDTLITMAVDLAAADVQFGLIDFGIFDARAEPFRDALALAGSIDSHRLLDQNLNNALAELDGRIALKDYSAPAWVLFLGGIQRARDFTSDSYASADYPANAKLLRLLAEGPEYGMHVIALADRPASVERRLTSGMLREFGVKILGTMAAADSRRLVDSEEAANLKSSEVYFDDYDRVISKTLRRFEVASPEWVVTTAARRASS